jgi:hypothetical protein
MVREESDVWTYGISVDLVVELEKDAETSACKGGMCRFGEDVIG